MLTKQGELLMNMSKLGENSYKSALLADGRCPACGGYLTDTVYSTFDSETHMEIRECKVECSHCRVFGEGRDSLEEAEQSFLEAIKELGVPDTYGEEMKRAFREIRQELSMLGTHIKDLNTRYKNLHELCDILENFINKTNLKKEE